MSLQTIVKIKQFVKKRVAILITSLALCSIGYSQTLYFDTSNGSGLNAGTGTWSTTSTNWNSVVGGTPQTWPATWVDGDNASFQTAGTNTITLSGSVTANSILQSVAGTTTSISGGTLISIGAGGISNSSGSALNLGSSISLNADQTWSPGTGGINVTGSISGSQALTISGSGTLTLGSGGSISSATTVTVNNGGTLLLSGANNQTSGVNLTLGGTGSTSGGTISLPASGSNVTQSFGTLSMTQSSIIDFGNLSGTNNLIFSSGSLGGGLTLSIYNWTAGTDHLFFGSVTGAGINPTQLSEISFYSGNGTGFLGTANFDANGEVDPLSPVPEPSTLLIGLGLCSLVGYRERRWFLRCRAARQTMFT